ncbi:ABC transporter ATP-binding protein [Peredibacter starrii]|uniref:ABC transporter ATP-binding protein n=1 Tax=Peredibacter starrii TaxID=28202 RepID=A0AAX4HMF6_9BACT|nr:ABC transporter ATP-binding protein [Peredibacter starrii]WPU64522.1 ABC transporter ATP-binding protein [Peredibacter starrii]
MSSRLHRRFGSWIIHHAFEFKWFYLGAFVCLYVLQVFQSQIPERIRQLTKLMSQGELGSASVWIFLGLAIGILFFRTFSRLLFFYPARVQQKLLRMELLELLETVPSTRYSGKSQGQIFQILFDDVNNLRAFIGFGLLQVGNLIIAGWVLIPKLNQTDSYLWPAFIPLFTSVVLFTIMTFINQKYFKKMMDKKGEVQQYIIEAYEAKQTIKNFHREESFIKGFVRSSSEELTLFFKSSIGFAITGPYVKLGLGASLLWAAMLIRKNGGDTSDLVFFSGFLYLFLEPVMFMSWVAVIMSQGFAAWKRVKELYGVLAVESKEELSLQNIKVKEDESSIHLNMLFWEKPINLNLEKGKWTVLIGETGSGKSYILSQLATGLILNKEVVSMVQQEPYLFNDTIQENIFLGATPNETNLKRASDLIKIFQLDNLAPTIDEVLKLEVGENGKRLSGGQMKRVALIRSLMSGAQLIIWDDPFSSVDIILERKVVANLRQSEQWGHLTFIISSHRLTTVRLSDEVIYLDREAGIKAQGEAHKLLKDENVTKFFKEQLVDVHLA